MYTCSLLHVNGAQNIKTFCILLDKLMTLHLCILESFFYFLPLILGKTQDSSLSVVALLSIQSEGEAGQTLHWPTIIHNNSEVNIAGYL